MLRCPLHGVVDGLATTADHAPTRDELLDAVRRDHLSVIRLQHT